MFEKKGFFLVDDPEVKLRLIREAAKASCPATVWTQSRAVVFRTVVSHFDLASGIFRTALPEDITLDKVLSIVGNRDGVFLNIDLSKTHILFRTTIHQFEQGKDYLEFKIPDEVYKIQQRKHPRVNTKHDTTVRAYHDDPLQPGRMIRRKVLDLSVAGMAVQLFFGEERHYHVGQKLSPFQLHLGQKILNCWAAVQNIRIVNQGSKRGELIMGLELNGLSESLQKHIRAYVDRNMVREFSTMMTESNKENSDSEKKGR